MNPIQFYTNLLQNPKYKWWVVGLTLVYIVSPVDIIPEFILPFGIIDDGAILFIMVKELISGRSKKTKI
jgi:uncharacterized membrane protein YkvA (DUF1232 family)